MASNYNSRPNRKERKELAKQARDRAHRRWTRGEERDLEREIHQGMYLEDIAYQHKRTNAAIEARASKLGVGPLHRRPRERGVAGNAGVTAVTAPAPSPTPARSGFFGRLFKSGS